MTAPQTLLLLDTETDGVHDGAICIEVACALYSVKRATVLRSYSSIMFAETNAAESLNRIPVSALVDAPHPSQVWAGVAKFAACADVIVAHNVEFDERFVPSFATCSKPWLCSMVDIAWPNATRPGENLVSLALAHGLGVASAHRAAGDVDLLARLFQRVSECHGVDHLEVLIARAMRPKAVFVVADRTFDQARNEQAKALGFAWDKPRAPRAWSRSMAIEDAGALPFEVREVGA